MRACVGAHKVCTGIGERIFMVVVLTCERAPSGKFPCEIYSNACVVYEQFMCSI